MPFPSPGGLPDPGIKPRSPALIGGFFFFPPGNPQVRYYTTLNRVLKKDFSEEMMFELTLKIMRKYQPATSGVNVHHGEATANSRTLRRDKLD